MDIDVQLDEEETEFHPGYTKYTVDIFMKDKEPQTILVKRDMIHNTYVPEGKAHPVLLKMAVDCVKNYVAKIYTQSSY
jgi:hypothetical protein